MKREKGWCAVRSPVKSSCWVEAPVVVLLCDEALVQFLGRLSRNCLLEGFRSLLQAGLLEELGLGGGFLGEVSCKLHVSSIEVEQKERWAPLGELSWVDRVTELDSLTSPLGGLSRKRKKWRRTGLILVWWPHGSWGPEWPIVFETCVPGQFSHLCVTLKLRHWVLEALVCLQNKEHVLQAWTTHVGRTVVHKYQVPTVE